MKNKYKAQIILITTLSLIITLSIVYIAVIPIFKFLKSIKLTTNYYQAVEIANIGLEIEEINFLPKGFDLLINTTSRYYNECYKKERSSICSYDNINEPSNNILNRISKYCQIENFDLNDYYLNLKTATTNYTTTSGGTTLVENFITSQGVYKENLVILKLRNFPVVCSSTSP